MSERKTLTSNLVTTPNQSIDTDLVRQFVKAGVGQKSIREISSESETTTTSLSKSNSDLIAKKRISKKMSEGVHVEFQNSRIHPIGLVPVTVRLTPSLAGALKRASLERELTGESFFTQQDIVQYLLEPWLKREGFL
jgi:hypothetical protein